MATPTGTGLDPMEAIAALEADLAAIPARTRPHQHAVAAYRLGLAYAEAPVGDSAANLRRALGCYDVAARAFDPRFDPVEHARVLNAAGAARRMLGDRGEANRLFERAAELMGQRAGGEELASVLNNLGLARSEMGDLAGGVAAFDLALPLFDTTTAQGRRAWVATVHNRGMAKAASGDPAGLEAALDDYQAALAELEPDEAPYHHGLVLHSVGVASTALAGVAPTERGLRLHQAVDAFAESLDFFSRQGFPFQHALAKFNQGVALMGLDTTDDLRRAMACLEDALAIFDPRLHPGPWRQAYDRLVLVDGRLPAVPPGGTRADHFAALTAGVSPEERLSLLRQRILRLVVMSEPLRAEALAEWGRAVTRLPRADARRVIEAELEVLMEVPNEALEAVLRAHFEANAALEPEPREEADRALDDAIGWAINGPQRVFVRDFLYSLGFERP
ncbi:MAG: hypothetical protein ACRDY0_12620 [Acidimicrobiales bacterium]